MKVMMMRIRKFTKTDRGKYKGSDHVEKMGEKMLFDCCVTYSV
jgi:hypothetical protein